MAPEIIYCKGYFYSADYWSLGICLYQLMCENLPFGENLEDPYEIYEEILKKQLSFPSSFEDKETERIIRQLLNKQPENRIFNLSEFKKDPWFKEFSWVYIYLYYFNYVFFFYC